MYERKEKEMEKKKEYGADNPQITACEEAESYLRGISWPNDKQTILNMAKSNGAPDSVMEMLMKVPDMKYRDGTAFNKELGKVEVHQELTRYLITRYPLLN